MIVRKLLFWGIALAFPLPLVWVLNAQLPDVLNVRFFISLGAIAYCWWLLSVLLSVRPRWLDRYVGLPQIYALHGMLGVFAIAAAYVHQENTFAASSTARGLGEWGFYIALGTLIYSVLFLSGWLTDRSVLVARIKRFFEWVLPHQVSVWLHRLNLVAIVLVWLHVHFIVRLSELAVFMIVFDVYIVVVLGIYLWKKVIAPEGFATGVVTENQELNGSTRRVAVALDEQSAHARAGDFFFVRVEGSGATREWHPFSVTTNDQDTLTFTIRQVGDYTRTIDRVPEGARVRLEGPFGRFDSIVRATPPGAPLILVGMGAGVAPLLSLASAYSLTRPVHLLWSVHSVDDEYYADRIEQLRDASQGLLTSTTQVGRFTQDGLRSTLASEQIRGGVFFVVGPNQAVLSVQRKLRRIGVPARRVHHERMTL